MQILQETPSTNEISSKAPTSSKMSKYVGRISLAVTMGIAALFPTSSSNSQIEPTSVKREMDTDKNSTQGERETLPSSIKQETVPREINSAPQIAESNDKEVDWKEEARKCWNRANSSITMHDLTTKIQEMNVALAQAGCTSEDIGVTLEEIKNCHMTLAKEEWERAKTLTIPYFQRNALDEMNAALKAGDLTIADIGVTEEMIKDLQLEPKSTGENEE